MRQRQVSGAPVAVRSPAERPIDPWSSAVYLASVFIVSYRPQLPVPANSPLLAADWLEEMLPKNFLENIVSHYVVSLRYLPSAVYDWRCVSSLSFFETLSASDFAAIKLMTSVTLRTRGSGNGTSVWPNASWTQDVSKSRSG